MPQRTDVSRRFEVALAHGRDSRATDQLRSLLEDMGLRVRRMRDHSEVGEYEVSDVLTAIDTVFEQCGGASF